MLSKVLVYSYTSGKGRLKFKYLFFLAMEPLDDAGCISNYAAKECPILGQLFGKNNLSPYIFLYYFGAILNVTREPRLPFCPKFLAMSDIKTMLMR